jgi:hypothetical protein
MRRRFLTAFALATVVVGLLAPAVGFAGPNGTGSSAGTCNSEGQCISIGAIPGTSSYRPGGSGAGSGGGASTTGSNTGTDTGYSTTAGGGCVVSSTPLVINGVVLGWMETMGTFALLPATGNVICGPTGSTTWVANTPPIPPTLQLADQLYGIGAQLATEVGIVSPTIFTMPSQTDPGPQPCASCVTPEDKVSAFANRPVWLAIDQGPHVTSGLSTSATACVPVTIICETVTITLTPATVNFKWLGGEQAPPFNQPPETITCNANESSDYAPASLARAQSFDASLPSLNFQFAGGNGHPVAGGPGCSATGSGSTAQGGTPPQAVDDVPNAGGGDPPVPFYTPTQVTGQDCTDVLGMPNHVATLPSWCSTVPKDATLQAWLVYNVAWTFSGPVPAPPGLPSTYDVATEAPAYVANMSIPVIAEHTVITCVGGYGSPGGCATR